MEDWLALDDAALLAQCRVDLFRASGPGGQHRNRNDTGVRLVHGPSGVRAQATERRSQAQNRANALRRLRRGIALEARRPVDLDRYHPPPRLQAILPFSTGAGEVPKHARIGPSHRDFWTGARALLDLLEATGGAVSDAAAAIGCSTGQLSRVLASEPRLFAAANAIRERRGLHPLRSR